MSRCHVSPIRRAHVHGAAVPRARSWPSHEPTTSVKRTRGTFRSGTGGNGGDRPPSESRGRQCRTEDEARAGAGRGQRGTRAYHAGNGDAPAPAPRVLSVRAPRGTPRGVRQRGAVPRRAADVIPATRRLPGRAGRSVSASGPSRFI